MHSPPPPPPKKPIPVTVWVHGTRPSSFLPQLRADVRNTIDAVAYAPQGLHKAQSLDPSLKHYKLSKVLAKVDPAQFPLEHFYVFGWQGDLDQTVRAGAAFDLYHTLKNLILEHTQHYGIPPDLTIISHSHGGNVVLEMVPYANKDNPEISVSRFIALACPVQKLTSRYALNPMFKKIYAMHSHIDMIQIMDPQRLHPLKKAFKQLIQDHTVDGFKNVYQEMIDNPLLSKRHFPLSSHIIHVDLHWSENKVPWQQEDIEVFSNVGNIIKNITLPLRKYHAGVLHTEFVIPTFIKELPHLLEIANQKTLSHIPTKKNPDIVLHI